MSEEIKGTAQTSEQGEDTTVDEKSTIQVEETSNDAESESQSTPEAKEQRHVQTKEENSEFARARREREQAKAIDKARAEAQAKATEEERVKNIIEFVGTNPYTKKPITNADEVNQYLRMRRIEQNGGDPMADYADEIDREEKARAKKRQDEADEQKRVQSDVSEFQRTHPNADLKGLLSTDRLFRALFNDKGDKSLNDVYSEYDAIISDITKNVEAKLTSEAAKKQSGVGSAQTNGSANPGITKTQFKRMSVDERSKLYEENRALYESLTK